MTCTAVIVQARMASTRLPGKVLLPLAGTTVLDHVLTRCAAITEADIVCCAIPDGTDCDPVAAEALRAGRDFGLQVFRGSETDVLSRYYHAARELGADTILRVTSDCPLIDPHVCDRVLRLRAERQADYAANNFSLGWPHGLDCEAFPFSWLERADKDATTPFEREHVTPYIRNSGDAIKANLAGPGGIAAMQRWTLDTAADLEFIRQLFDRLPPGSAGWDYRLPLQIVTDDPSLAEINAADNVRHSGTRASNRGQIA